MLKKIKEWNPSILATILLLLFPFIIFGLKEFKLDNDFWFLYNTGKVIIQKGFIMIEPFTIHENLAFIPQQWLTDIIFYFIYNKFNIIGMLILELIINGLIIFLFYKLSMLISNRNNSSIIISIILDSFLLIIGIITTRPQMFDIVLFTLEIYLLENYIKKDKKICLYFLPIISILLINLHASMWLMFFVFLIPYYIEYVIKIIKKEKTYNIKLILIITIISFLVGFINPYTYHSILYLFNSYGIKEINNVVREMRPINIVNSRIVYFIMLFNLFIIYLNKGNNKIRYILLFLGTMYLCLTHLKGLLFFIISNILIISNYCYSSNKLIKIKLNKFEKIIYISLMIILVLFISLNIKIYNENNNPLKEIADYLDNDTNKNIKLFTGYNEGSYLEYRGYKCYIDPRAEVFLKNNNHKEDIFLEYYNINNKISNVQDFLNKYNFDYLIVTEDHKYLLYEMQKNNNYEKIKEIYDKDKNLNIYLYKRINI